jgi:Tol biopolymer transport system component
MKRAWFGALIATLAVAVPAQATFPGDNGRVAYTWSRGGEAFEAGPRPLLVGVVSVRPDGTGRVLVARGGSHPAYSPDGRLIAFLRSQRLWVARADGSSARPVTPSGWLVGDQEWSPGGTRLAFVRAFDESVRSVVYTVKHDGSGLQRLLKAPMPVRLYDGAWSPDGRAIVYLQSRFRGSVVRAIRGGRIVSIANGAGRPTWSRHGLIAYQTRTQVCIERRDPEDSARCVGSPDGLTSAPVWWPDGRRLRVLFTPRGEGSAEVWTVRPDGTVLSRRAGTGASSPVFSPDGRLLAWSVTRFRGDPRLGSTDLLVERADGSGRRTLIRGGQAQAPDWQPRP